jgi:hypothetical protein
MNNDQLNEKLAAFGMRLEFWRVEDLLKLVKNTKNPKKHYNKDIDALSKAISELGFKGAVSIDKDATEIGAGVGRIMAAQRNGLDELPVFRILDLDKIKFKKFRIGDNRLPQLSNKWDEDILLEDMTDIVRSGQDIDWLDFDKFDKLLQQDAVTEDVTKPEFMPSVTSQAFIPPTQQLGSAPLEPDGLPPVVQTNNTATIPKDINDEEFAVDFSSSNEWGIPDLDPRFQATGLHIPFVKWGEISYKKSMHGVWCFYVEDEKFESISDNPMKPLLSMPTDLVELNYSTYDTQPAALAIGQVFFKRWVSRFWQSKGFNVIVDLNVQPQFSKMNLIGVPKGWRAYATRGSGERTWVEHDYEIALEHSEADPGDILFIIYGGGQAIQEFANEHHCHWIPERMQVVSNPKLAGLDGLDVKVNPDKYSDL